MAKAFYIGVDGKARLAKKMYIGVDGKAHKVKKSIRRRGRQGKAGVPELYPCDGDQIDVENWRL